MIAIMLYHCSTMSNLTEMGVINVKSFGIRSSNLSIDFSNIYQFEDRTRTHTNTGI